MKRPHVFLAAVPWAVAILAAALSGAPTFFSQILLPLMAAMSLRSPAGSCLTRSPAP